MIEEKKRQEIKKFKNLINCANYWKQTIIIREYLAAVEKHPGLTDRGKEWLEWAKKKVEWFDPFINAQDEILDNNDRNKLIEGLT